MTEEEFGELLARGHEIQGIEFKGPGPRTNKLLFAMVMRASMGMSNRRDGGLVVIGVGDDSNSLDPIGITATDLKTWSFDHISAGFAPYADPSIVFERQVQAYNGKQFIVLQIHEFVDIPVLCKKPLSINGKIKLREGACYIRSNRKPETAEVSTAEDMRALLDLAKQKALNKWVADAQESGILASSTPVNPTDQTQFENQLGEL